MKKLFLPLVLVAAMISSCGNKTATTETTMVDTVVAPPVKEAAPVDNVTPLMQTTKAKRIKKIVDTSVRKKESNSDINYKMAGNTVIPESAY